MELTSRIPMVESPTVVVNWVPTLAVCAAVTAGVIVAGSVARPLQPRVQVLSDGPVPAHSAPGSQAATSGAVACPGGSPDSKSPLPQPSSECDWPPTGPAPMPPTGPPCETPNSSVRA